jgi:hypothetical protein
MHPSTFGPVLGTVLAVAACGLGHDGKVRHDADAWSRGHAFDHLDRALDRANASPEQRLHARMIVGRAAVDLEPWPDAGARMRAALLDAWRSDAPDREALHRRIDEEIDALRSLGHALVDDAVDLHHVFTSEQREALARDVR